MLADEEKMNNVIVNKRCNINAFYVHDVCFYRRQGIILQERSWSYHALYVTCDEFVLV